MVFSFAIVLAFESANVLAITLGLNANPSPKIELVLRKRRRDWSSACFITFSGLLVLDPHFRDPLPDVCGTIPELDTIGFTIFKKIHRVLVHQGQFDQV